MVLLLFFDNQSFKFILKALKLIDATNAKIGTKKVLAAKMVQRQFSVQSALGFVGILEDVEEDRRSATKISRALTTT